MKGLIKTRFIVARKQINKKNTWSSHAKEHYWSLTRKKKSKLVNQSEIIPYQTKIFGNPSTVDIKLIITEQPKTHN